MMIVGQCLKVTVDMIECYNEDLKTHLPTSTIFLVNQGHTCILTINSKLVGMSRGAGNYLGCEHICESNYLLCFSLIKIKMPFRFIGK